MKINGLLSTLLQDILTTYIVFILKLMRVVQKVLSLIGSRYILKCFTALEWCVEQLTIPVYFVQIAFQLTELFQIEIDAVIHTDQFTCYIGTWTRRLKFVAILNAALGLI